MNSMQRLIASGRGEPLDCVPVSPGISTYCAVKAGQPMTRVAYDPELMADVILQSLDRHGHDSVGAISDYGVVTEAMGSRSVIRDWEQTYVDRFAVKSKADVAHLRLPDPLQDGRMPVIIECQKILVAKVGNSVSVGGSIPGPLSFAANLCGPQRILYDLVDDPEMVHDLLAISVEAVNSFALAQVDHGGVRSISIFDPMITMVSNRMADEFGFAYIQPLIKSIKERNVPILFHICGDTTRLLERMIEVGTDILSVDVEVDLAEAKEIISGRASLSGNVATQNLARLGPEEIYQESCRCIEKAALGGRFTLSASCEVPLETPPENIDAMVRAAREFGREFLEKSADREV